MNGVRNGAVAKTLDSWPPSLSDVVPWSGILTLAFLNVIDGPARGLQFGLERRNVMIGRDDSCAISIPDGRISRRHLQIVYDPDGDRHVAVDVGSSNGVAVNGTRLERGTERALEDGDEIGIGGSRLRYTRDATSQAPPTWSTAAGTRFGIPGVQQRNDKTLPG